MKLTKIYISDKNKAGEPFISKRGLPFKKIGILTEGNSIWAYGFIFNDDSPMLKWKEGDEVDIVIEQNGQYTNFRLPRKEDMILGRLDFLEQKVNRIASQLEKKEIKKETKPF